MISHYRDRIRSLTALVASLTALSGLWRPEGVLQAEWITGQTSAPARDTMSDTWAATDALGRVLPNATQAGSPRPDRWVGVFYFLWHGPHVSGGPYNISEILLRNLDAMRNPGRISEML